MNELITQDGIEVLINMASNGKAQNTRIAYGRAIESYQGWAAANRAGFNRLAVFAFIQHMKDKGSAAATINLYLSALRRLAKELRYADAMPADLAKGIEEVENVPHHGERVGNWLSPEEATLLLSVPDPDTLQGKQEQVLLALMLGAALRREELSDLTFEMIQLRDGKWLIVNLVGKHNRVRTIPLPAWVMKNVLDWMDAAGIDEGKVLRAVSKSDKLTGSVKTKDGSMTDGGMSPQAIYNRIKKLCAKSDLPCISPHDLRRTWAQTAFKQGAPLDQIKLILGHSDLRTTEIYLGLRNVDLDEPVYVEYGE